MNSEIELLRDANRIRPEFYEDFEDVNGMVFHNGAELADGKVCFLLPPANEVVGRLCFYRCLILSTGRGACVVAVGGVCGCGGRVWLWGACMVVGRCAWLRGACMVAGGYA